MTFLSEWRVPQPAGVLIAALTILCSGCAGAGGGGMFGSSYTVAADDSCGTQRQALKAYQDYFFASMIQGAAIGALGGGLAGLALGGNAQSAAIGAGAGALVGGTVGYYSAKQKANSNPAELTNSVYTDVNHENGQIDGVSATFNNLRDCRLRSAEAVKRDYREKRIPLADAQTRLQTIRQRYLEDVDFAAGLGKKMDERGGEYQNASTQIMTLDPNASATLARRESAGGGSGGAGRGGLVANESARVHEQADASSRQVGTVAQGTNVQPINDTGTPADWTHVQLSNGKSGYVVSRLLRPAGTAAPSRAAPPSDAAGVAELTQSNQLKRKALSDEVASARTEANGSAFELQGGISRAPAPAWRRDAA
jgi:hypothetical protein